MTENHNPPDEDLDDELLDSALLVGHEVAHSPLAGDSIFAFPAVQLRAPGPTGDASSCAMPLL